MPLHDNKELVDILAYGYVPTVAAFGFGVSYLCYRSVAKIRVEGRAKHSQLEMSPRKDDQTQTRGGEPSGDFEENVPSDLQEKDQVFEIYTAISEGAISFLKAEYSWLAVYMVLFGILLLCVIGGITKKWDDAGFAVLCFLTGATTSILAGYVGMCIATFSNARTTLKCQESLNEGFKVALRGGFVMGFYLVASCIVVLWGLIVLIKLHYDDLLSHEDVWTRMFKSIAAFGVGTTSVALFARVGGGIYTKAADVGADLVGKVENNIPEDDPRNPATIADNVGDNVGDIAGMGADLFGSMAGSTCACLVLSSEIREFTKNIGEAGSAKALRLLPMLFPLGLYATGLVSSFFAMILGFQFIKVEDKTKIKKALQFQEFFATLFSALLAIPITYFFFGAEHFHFRNLDLHWGKVYGCVV